MAQVDGFLKIDGVEGESQDDKHKGEIHILTYHLGAANSAQGGRDVGSGVGKAMVHDMLLTKYVDKSSPMLFQSCCNGKHFANATLTLRKAGEKPHEFMKYKMDNVFISNVATKTTKDDHPQESISLNFSAIELTYVQQNKDGTAGASIVKKHDIAANKST